MTKYIAPEIAVKLKLQIAAIRDSVSSLVDELKLAREENDDLLKG
ncbi:hypothetical protein VCRA2119O147_890015 [Vibrio crassostreae]|uniref:Uncharacterized protein n=1 Tax=Vibrio crassostreae TaxID=246167 RepID=A0ABP1X175_9VIBR|nr:hypothetical protein [Vibrio crassostreae]CAK1694743.1 hypothetical protein VCRA2119O430_100030 [Vibrio crassostreae]CAK1706633.1 hypothetical protein VCRA2113O409_100135 [Vibrio crassostreae]CAK1711867.1 hypothetical protein VCRA2117O428_110030 [Vibrio crassostreae]CAK1712713.1 hypothetical protein VCRA2113O416_110030 [Vibrio crassostreae]CAK1714876.1 hypothetical protein VCRA2113O411_110030 [Vibrio crassostreae]